MKVFKCCSITDYPTIKGGSPLLPVEFIRSTQTLGNCIIFRKYIKTFFKQSLSVPDSSLKHFWNRQKLFVCSTFEPLISFSLDFSLIEFLSPPSAVMMLESKKKIFRNIYCQNLKSLTVKYGVMKLTYFLVYSALDNEVVLTKFTKVADLLQRAIAIIV